MSNPHKTQRLLRMLRSILDENISNAKINLFLEEEVSNMLTKLTDRRQLKKTIHLRRELNNLITELREV